MLLLTRNATASVLCGRCVQCVLCAAAGLCCLTWGATPVAATSASMDATVGKSATPMDPARPSACDGTRARERD